MDSFQRETLDDCTREAKRAAFGSCDDQLRVHAYPRLAGIASSWMEALGTSERFPPTLATFLARCAKAGQDKPTPLLLHYEAGGYNCLHQDVYGAVGFPLLAGSARGRATRWASSSTTRNSNVAFGTVGCPSDEEP